MILNDQNDAIDLYTVNDGGLQYSPSPVSYSPSAPMPVLLAEPAPAPAAVRVQPTGGCRGCGGGGGDTGEALMPANLMGDTRIDAGVSIGWRELLIFLLVAAAARYFELI